MQPLLLGCACLAGIAAPAFAAPKYQATIVRTTFGIPHITAKDFGGLGFGAAYAEAEHNICLMAEDYISASGQRSKYFGADKETHIGLWPGKNIDSDVYYRSITDTKKLQASFTRVSADLQAMIDGWVAGYNRFLQDRQGKLPAACAGAAWVRPITRDDALRSINGFNMVGSSAVLGPNIANASPPGATTGSVAATAKYASAAVSLPVGSNGWAFGGDATTNGRGLVVNNPHYAWFGPNRFYQKQLTIPGKFNMEGVSITNQPFLLMGFNKDVAWTHTVDTAPHMTLFKLNLDPADATAYLVDGKREAMIRRTISIENKDGPAITRTVYSSRYGPIVSLPDEKLGWSKTTAYALKDANNGNLRSGDTWIDMAKARNVQELKDALGRTLGVPFVNTMAADRHGDALYAEIAAIPNVSNARFAACGQDAGRTGKMLQHLFVLDGSRTACGWENAPGTPELGLRPASQLPTLIRRDYVQNSNDSYRLTNPAAAIGDFGPMFNNDQYATPDGRTRMAILEIGRVLKSGKKFDLDLAAQTIWSNRSLGAEIMLPSLLTLCKRPTAPADACAALAKWDGKATLESRGVNLFTFFWLLAWERADFWAVKFDAADPINTPRGLVTEGKIGDDILNTLTQAAAIVKAKGEALDAPLGTVQFARRGDEHIPIAGTFQGGVLNINIAAPTPQGDQVTHGASFVNTVTFDENGPVAKGLLTYSQSTDPASPNYADQTRAWSRQELHRIPFSDAEIAADRVGEPITIHN